ncbi:MAG: hypothetical protein J5590_08565 [Clostridia bacterium]|nr:hypothetical protein [Clostridia bacterium]
MKKHENQINLFLCKNNLLERIAFYALPNELHYHDSLYGTPATTLKVEDGKYQISSRRDAERGIVFSKTFQNEKKAINYFMEMLKADTYNVQQH